MNRYVLALACAALLAGCGSSVKLDDVAVEDKAGTPVGALGGAGAVMPPQAVLAGASCGSFARVLA